MDFEGNSIIPRPDKPDTYFLNNDTTLVWTNASAPILIPTARRGFSQADRYILTIHLVYLWSRGAPDWILQIYDAETDILIHEQTEGIDSYSNRVSTLNEQIIVPTRNLRYLAIREDDNLYDLTIISGSFCKVEKFA